MSRRFARFLALCAALCAFACVVPHANAEPPAPHAAPASAAHQVLVMLRMPSPHFRPDGAYGGGYTNDGTRAARRRVARELAAAYGLRVIDNWPMPAIGIDCFVMEDTGTGPVDRLLDTLAHDPRVAWAQAIQEYRSLGGGDPLLPVQPAAQLWQLTTLHRASTGRGVTVAVVDSGVDANHPDLAGQVKLRRNFVDAYPDGPEAHGTAVAGIIAAREGNGQGIAGIAPDAKLLALRACWETAGPPARCNSFTLGKAINFALMNDAGVINMSLGGPRDRLLEALLDAALARGVTLVGAADPAQPDGGFPASHPGVIAVASDTQRAPPPGALRAPGTDVPTALPGARWGMVSGSSYAAAHVAGLAALILELRPGIAPARLRADLDGGARVFPAALASSPGQAGSIDACAAIARAAGTCVCLCPSTTTTASLPSPRPH
ncbi:S8 family peptidase [Massilia luteola]|uniref:S8 family peptidase n=1 Tax=Massilia luteola TaxID=3081751 RepID=UPI002ACC0B29|nr:S8 family serine peptidase [Massilia sp. Gc5]